MDEVLEFLKNVLNGSEKDYDKNNEPVSVSVSHRIKAAELMIKILQNESSSDDCLPVVICEDL